jgi:bifunctional non-homologous end joining protein LigD
MKEMSLFQQMIKPMLAEISEPFDSDEWAFEIKFDGTRTIAYIDVEKREVKFLNRRLKFFQFNYPELRELWKDVDAKKIILDGEVVVFEKGKPNFYKLAEREHVGRKAQIELLSKIMPATFVVFDILHLNGQDLVDKPLIERKKILEKVVKESPRVLLSAYVIGKGKKFFQEVRKKGLEGIMAKRLKSTYQVGKRSKDWLKIKHLKTLDCIICAYTKGSGWREKYFGALVLGCYHQGKLRYVGRVGTGLDEKGYAELTQILQKLKTEKCPFEKKPEFPSGIEVTWVKPKLICEVRFMNLSKDLIMRAPAFLRLREDKEPKECILETIK